MNSFLDNIKTALIVGEKGSGKTTGFLFNEFENFIIKNESFLVIDNKLEYYNNYLKMLKIKGYEVLVINFDDPSHSDNYNPLIKPYKLYNSGLVDASLEKLRTLANYIIGDVGDVQNLFLASALLLFTKFSIQDINMGNLCNLINAIYTQKFDYYFFQLNDSHPIKILINSCIHMDYAYQIIKDQLVNYYLLRPNLLNLLANDKDIFAFEKKAIFIKCSKLDESSRLIPYIVEEYALSDNISFGKNNLILEYIDEIKKINNLEYIVNYVNNLRIIMVTKNLDYFKSKYGLKVVDLADYIFVIHNGNFRFNNVTYDLNYIYDKKFKEDLPTTSLLYKAIDFDSILFK